MLEYEEEINQLFYFFKLRYFSNILSMKTMTVIF